MSLVCVRSPFIGFSTPHVVASAEIPLAESASDTDRLGALARELTDQRWQNTEATVVLSDRLARYFIADRPDGARNAEEVRLAGHLRFEDVFGESSDAWEIRLDMLPFAIRQLGCALRKDFVADLMTTCADCRIRLASLVPLAIAEFNRWQPLLDGKDGWFAVLGRNGVWMGKRSGSDWVSVSQCAATANLDEALQRMLVQDSLRTVDNGGDLAVLPTVWVAGDLTDGGLRQRVLSTSWRLLGAPAWPRQSDAWSATHRIALSHVWPACV